MKRGFTLIELLAVIVILAIIALIAVPIVLNIINDAKTSSSEQSVELYLDTVEKTITNKQLSNPNFNPDKCEIQDNGDLKCYKNNELIDTVEIEMKGQMPNKGEITILNNKFNYKNIWFNNKKYYAIATLLDDADNNNEMSIGDKYLYKVNDTDTFNFYILSFNEDDTVNLIMDRNICEDGTTDYREDNNYCIYNWSKENINANGPLEIMEAVYKATKDWTNISNLNFSYSDSENGNVGMYGYMGISISNGKGYIIKKDGNTKSEINVIDNKPIKARLPKYSEVNSPLVGCSMSAGSCPNWILENLRYWNGANDKYVINKENTSGTKKYNIFGYWLLSSYPNDSENGRNICFVGRIDYSNSGCTLNHGLRPVITVPIEELS